MTALGGPAPARRSPPWASLAAHLPGWTDWAYALSAALCALLVLWLAMWLELDAPYWAASTVLITSQASRAQGLLKGVNLHPSLASPRPDPPPRRSGALMLSLRGDLSGA